jgi:CubicO group peptidase (beta-lactamase class C family)
MRMFNWLASKASNPEVTSRETGTNAEYQMTSDEALPKTATAIRAGIAEGLHIGAQLYVSLADRVVADLAFGESRAGVAMTPETLMLWMSATKPVTAVAIAQLWERGLLELDDPVARHVPEFAQNGKGGITIRHVLTHTGGFRAGLAWNNTEWEQIIQQICASRLEPRWVPGKKAGYHVATGWYILAEIVQQLDGRLYPCYVRETIFEPLGMRDSWIGMPEETYRAYDLRMGLMQVTEMGQAVAPTPEEAEQNAVMCRPSGNGHGPIRELGRLYEMLRERGSLNGTRVLLPQTVEAITARHRTGMLDHTFQFVMDWGLGFILSTNPPGEDAMPYGYGPYASPRTFGHGGHQSSVGFCDPERGLVVALVFNGKPGEARHHARRGAVLRAIYEDLRFED